MPKEFADPDLMKQTMEALSSERNISILDLDRSEYAAKISFFLSEEFMRSTETYQILLTSYDGIIVCMYARTYVCVCVFVFVR